MPIRPYYRLSGLKQISANNPFSRFCSLEPIIEEFEPHYVTPEEDKRIRELDETLMQMDAYFIEHCHSREELAKAMDEWGRIIVLKHPNSQIAKMLRQNGY